MTTPLLHPIDEVGSLLGIGRTSVYNLASCGEIKVVHIGRRALVTAESLLGYVARITADPVSNDAA